MRCLILSHCRVENRVDMGELWGRDDGTFERILDVEDRINVYEIWFSRDEINDYYSIYTMTTSPYLYITTMYSYLRTSPSLNKLYNIQLQYFRAKFFYSIINLLQIFS